MDMFQALGDKSRRSIIELLSKKGQLTSTDISNQFHISAPAISQHLKVLREAKEKSINLVLYRPRTHELLKSETTRFTKGEAKWLGDVKSLAKEYSIPFYDFEQPGSLACDYFADTSHLSKSCFPEVVEKILLEGTNKNRTDLR
jgi:DNA-binding transcriptional ArsR family regulator